MSDVHIIGGGIAGLLTALELSNQGLRVSIIERGRLAREASWAGGGILSPLYPWRYSDHVNTLARYGQKEYPKLCKTLSEKTGVDPQYIQSGLLIHAPSEEEQALSWAEQWKLTAELVEAERIAELEPARADPPSPMLWFPEIAQVRNPRLMKALIEALAQAGVEVREEMEVTSLEPWDNGILRLHTAGGEKILAERVVVCAGAWSRKLLEALPTPPEIRPVRGQMLLFRGRPDTIHHMMLEDNRYVIPRKDGRILFGSSIEDVGFDKQESDTVREELHRIAASRFPVLADFPIEAHWAGLRPGSPDGIPFIGPHPSVENLWVNAGHFRNGIVLGPASARLTAELVAGRTPFIDPAPYALTAPRGGSD